VEENWSVVHLVFEHCKTLEMVEVYLAEKFKLIALSFKEQLTIWSNVAGSFVLVLLVEDFFGRLLVAVVVTAKARSHPEVVYQKRMLVNVLEHTELALIQ
jgi:hypothetical protein